MNTKRFIAMLIVIAFVIGTVPTFSLGETYESTDYSIPALTSFTAAGSGKFSLTEGSRIYVVNEDGLFMSDSGYSDYVETVRLITSDFAEKGKPTVNGMNVMFGSATDIAQDDLVLNLDAATTLFDSYDSTLRSQAFQIVVSSTSIIVTAKGLSGLLSGARTVLQYEITHSGMDYGTYLAVPDSAERSLFLDCGRKYYSVSTLKTLIREMYWCGLNALELHFSEDMGLRLESTLYPWLAKGGDINVFGYDAVTANYTQDENQTSVLTQAEMADVISYAKVYGIEIIPSFDMPGHMNYIVAQYDEYVAANGSLSFTYDGVSYTATSANSGAKIGNYFKLNGSFVQYSSHDGTYSRGIDISNDYARAFAFSLLEEYAAFFRDNGCTKFNLCADECLGYSVTMNGTTYTTASTGSNNLWNCLGHWQSYAVNTLGITNGTAYDAFISFVNSAVSILKAEGYADIRVFNDEAYRSPTVTQHVSLDSDVDICYWDYSSSYLDSPIAVANDGRVLYNFDNTHAYYVLSSSYASSYPNMNVADIIASGGVYSFDGVDMSAYVSSVGGGSFAIWCDNPGYQTQSEVLSSITGIMRARAAKLWKDSYSVTSAAFSGLSSMLSSAPASSQTARAAVLPTSEDHSELRSYIENVLPIGTNSQSAYAAYIAAVGNGATVDDNAYATAEELASAVAAIETAIAGLTDTSPTASPEPTAVEYSYTDPAGNTSTIEYYGADTIELPIVIRDYNNDGMLFEYASSEDTTAHTTEGSGNIPTPNLLLTGTGNTNTTYTSSTPETGVTRFTVTGTGSYITYSAGGVTSSTVRYAAISYRTNAAYSSTPSFRFRTSSSTASTDTLSAALTYNTPSTWQTCVVDFGTVTAYSGTSALAYLTFYPRLAAGKYVELSYIALFDNSTDANSYAAQMVGPVVTPETIITSETVMGNNLAFGLLFDSMDASYTSDSSHLHQGYGDVSLSPSNISDTLGSGLNKSQTSNQYKLIQAGKNSGGGNTISTFSTNNDGSGNLVVANTRITGYARTGLVSATLGADKRVRYTQGAIEYLASLLEAALAIPEYTIKYNSNSGNTPYNSYNYAYVSGEENSALFGVDSNGDARDFAQYLRDKNLSGSETYSSTASSFDGTLSGINSYMDAAYFMLNSLHTDKYSQTVEEYNELVLHKEVITQTNGTTRTAYVFDSAYESTDYNSGTGRIANTGANRVDWTYPNNMDKMNLNGIYVPAYPFLPINNMGYGSTYSPYIYDDGVVEGNTSFGDEYTGNNYNFALEGHAKFVYHQTDNLYFMFAGDDDVYLYINDVLVLDIGAAHGITEEKLLLNNLGLVDGETYDFDFYYLERHGYGANLHIETNIVLASDIVSVEKTAEQGGTAIEYGGQISPMESYSYAFSMTNDGNSHLSNLSFVDPTLGVTLSYAGLFLGDYGDSNTARTAEELVVSLYDASAGTTTEYANQSEEQIKTLLAAGLDADDIMTVSNIKYRLSGTELSLGSKTNTVTGTAYTTSGETISGRATMLVTYEGIVDMVTLGAQAHIIHKTADILQPMYTNGIRFAVTVNYKSLQQVMDVGEYFNFGMIMLPTNRLFSASYANASTWSISPNGQSGNDAQLQYVQSMMLNADSSGNITTAPSQTSSETNVAAQPSAVFFNSAAHTGNGTGRLTLNNTNMVYWSSALENAASLSDFVAELQLDTGVQILSVDEDAGDFIYCIYLMFSNGDAYKDTNADESAANAARLAQANREIAYRGVFVKLSKDASDEYTVYDVQLGYQKTNSATRIFRHYFYYGASTGDWANSIWLTSQGDLPVSNDLNGWSLFAPSEDLQEFYPAA